MFRFEFQQLFNRLMICQVVLLNLVQLQSLQVEYCPWLRKSEDLAIAYQVAKEPGGETRSDRTNCDPIAKMWCGSVVSFWSSMAIAASANPRTCVLYPDLSLSL